MAMDIIQANIDRFKWLLTTETDPKKRAMEIRLLAEEQAKQVPGPSRSFRRHYRILPARAS
jgi:hypothetical protein